MILVAIGANLPGMGGLSPRQTCAAAVAAMAKIPGLRLENVSRWYESDPVPPSSQPPYVNGAARLSGGIDPADLLMALQAIEAEAGRLRSVPNAARTLDLDIIAMGAFVRDAPDPVLPHPRAHLRGFVLHPVRDIAPEWRHPRLGLTVEQMLEAVPAGGIRAI